MFSFSLFFKGFVYITKQLQHNVSDVQPLPKELDSAAEGFHYKPPKSSQYYQVVSIFCNENLTQISDKINIFFYEEEINEP